VVGADPWASRVKGTRGVDFGVESFGPEINHAMGGSENKGTADNTGVWSTKRANRKDIFSKKREIKKGFQLLSYEDG